MRDYQVRYICRLIHFTLPIYSVVYRALLAYIRGKLRQKVRRVVHSKHLKDLILVVHLLLVLQNTFWLTIGVQDVVRLWVGADEGSIFNCGKAEASRGVDVAVAAEYHLEGSDRDTEDWDWEEVYLLAPWELSLD